LEKSLRRLERDIEKQEEQIRQLDEKISENAADYVELTRLLQEKEREEETLFSFMEQWEQITTELS